MKRPNTSPEQSPQQTRMAQPEDYASGAILKHPVYSCLGLEVAPDNTMEVVDDGDDAISQEV